MKFLKLSISLALSFFVSSCSEKSKKSEAEISKSSNTSNNAQDSTNTSSANQSSKVEEQPLSLKILLDCTQKSEKQKWNTLDRISGTIAYSRRETNALMSVPVENGFESITNIQKDPIDLGPAPLVCDKGDIKVDLKFYSESNKNDEFQPSVSTILDCEKIKKKVKENYASIAQVLYRVNLSCSKSENSDSISIESIEDITVINKAATEPQPISAD